MTLKVVYWRRSKQIGARFRIVIKPEKSELNNGNGEMAEISLMCFNSDSQTFDKQLITTLLNTPENPHATEFYKGIKNVGQCQYLWFHGY